MDDYQLTIKHLRAKQQAVNLKARYGISLDQYRALLRYQERKCAGCGKPAKEARRGLAVDHDHTCCPYGPNQTLKACGKCIRGLLCSRCNLTDALAGAPSVNWDLILKK